MTTILVTGTGAIIGYGILRAFRKSDRYIRLIGADIYDDAVGQAWADKFVLAPLTSSNHYLNWLEKVIVENHINLVMPGIEQDVHFFSEHRNFFNSIPVNVALNDQRLINLTRDKWLMHQELLGINSEIRIPSYIEGDFESLSKKLGVPFILKPRCSYASKGLVRIQSKADFMFLSDKLGGILMAQPIIGSDNEEYTVAVFGNGQGQVCASITLQRRLAADGSTAKAWVRQHDKLDEVVASLCAHFKPIGPTNLQFRRDGNCWKLLEINPRISSTTSLRTAFGYNEPEMCLNFYLEGKKIIQPTIKKGFAVRYIEDCVIYDRDHF
ncbi:MAG: ATP-grasp domain-containing protein [Desulfocapsaceae bacterium]|nr:ATP-grasp domain-containing protein [Desulfocapsaceae bacterium]